MVNFRTQSYVSGRDSGFYPAVMSAEVALGVLSEAGTGVWSYVAGAPCALLSHAARQVLGLAGGAELPDADRWLDHIHPADQMRVLSEMERVASEPGTFVFEARIVAAAGDARWVEVDGQSHHEDGRFVRAGGTVRAAGSRKRPDILRDLRVGASLPCARRPANLGMIAATVIDEMQAVHPAKTIHLVLSGHLDGEWDAERIAQAIANLVAKALEGNSDRPVVIRVSGRGTHVHLLIEGFGPAKRGPFIAREIVRAHGGALHEIPSNVATTRFLAVLPRRAC
jgi:signal transduction histidine kinase